MKLSPLITTSPVPEPATPPPPPPPPAVPNVIGTNEQWRRNAPPDNPASAPRRGGR